MGWFYPEYQKRCDIIQQKSQYKWAEFTWVYIRWAAEVRQWVQNFKLKWEEIHQWGSVSSSSLWEAEYEYDQRTDLDPIFSDKGLSQEKIELKKSG